MRTGGIVGRDNVALGHLMDAVLRRHQSNRAAAASDPEADYVDFSDEQVAAMVETLWVDRFTESRKQFQDSVSAAVSNKVSKS